MEKSKKVLTVLLIIIGIIILLIAAVLLMNHFYLSKIKIVTDDRNDLTFTVADSEGYITGDDEYTHGSEVIEDKLLSMQNAIDKNTEDLTDNIFETS